MIQGIDKKLYYGEGNSNNSYKMSIGVNDTVLLQESTCKDYIQDVVLSCLYCDKNYEIYGFKSSTVTEEEKKMLKEAERFQIFLIRRSTHSHKITLAQRAEKLLEQFDIFENNYNVPTRMTIKEDTFKTKENVEEQCLVVEVDKWYLEKLYRLSFLTYWIRELNLSTFEEAVKIKMLADKVKERMLSYINGEELAHIQTFNGKDVHNGSGIIASINYNLQKNEKN